MEAKKHNFERGKCIGKGTYGKVFLCFDKNERQKKFAMKVIDLEGSPEDERNMAEKEAILLTTLQHKYILHALTTFQENETLCIVTEFCDQGNLEQFLNKRKGNLLEERQIVEWFRQICSALEYLHGRNILHRDIKTQNIFLTGKEMTIKLGDLGLAKVLESSIQKASTFCGSPHYISPEILACKPYNSKSDIWAMGVCVYEMTTLRRPFDACLQQQLYLKIANDQLPPIPKDEYSPQLIKVIERMLCRDTDYRPTATELLQDVLFKNQQTSKRMTSEEGQFKLGALIGEGAFGKVFERFDKKDGKKKIVMKKIDLRKSSADDRNLAETEARLLTSLQNEYILHVVTAFQEKETLCIVTEFCDQGDLARFLEGRKGESLDEQQIVEWFQQICSALEYLHGRNILHRNIKTQNIFLTGKEMTAKLGNFGLAKVLESFNNEDVSVRDSPYYMNPDVFAYIQYNSKTDIWALGVCVYKMVALKLPFDVPEIQQLGLNIFHDKLPPLPNGYSRELIEIIKWMMCRETERRPSALELLQNVLFENHSASKVLFLPDEKTTRGTLSTYEDMDKTISDNPEYESYLPSKSTVSNSESFEARTPDTELSKVSGSETSSENEKYFERTMAADRGRSTFRPPPSTFTIIRSVFRSVKDWMIGGAGSYEINCATEMTENADKKSLQDDGKENFSAESRERLKNQKRLWNKNLPNEKKLYVYFWKEQSVFSQWFPCKFTVGEITYSSAEQYMMHQKAVLMDDKESAEIILALNKPDEIKKIGRHIQNFNQELWENCCLDVVEKGNMAKFSQNEDLRDKLFHTYPKTLVEASPIDRIWGIGLSEKDKRAWNKETWRGQNLLGEILTKVRNTLLKSFLEPVDTVKEGFSATK